MHRAPSLPAMFTGKPSAPTSTPARIPGSCDGQKTGRRTKSHLEDLKQNWISHQLPVMFQLLLSTGAYFPDRQVRSCCAKPWHTLERALALTLDDCLGTYDAQDHPLYNPEVDATENSSLQMEKLRANIQAQGRRTVISVVRENR